MFNFFLLSFYFKYFPGSIFTNSITFASADMISYFLSGLLMRCLNTNQMLILGQTISSTGAILYFFLYSNEVVVPIVILLSRFGNSVSFNTVYITNNRLFPVYLMSSTFGLLNFISHLITVGAPMVAEMPDPYPFAVFLANSLIALVSAVFLKELYHGKEDSIITH